MTDPTTQHNRLGAHNHMRLGADWLYSLALRSYNVLDPLSPYKRSKNKRTSALPLIPNNQFRLSYWLASPTVCTSVCDM